MSEPEGASTRGRSGRLGRLMVGLPRALGSLAAAGLAVACSGALLAACGGSAATHSHTTHSSTSPHPPGTATPQPVVLATVRATRAGVLPAPVQDPATTALGDHALLVGGLDS